MEQVIAGGVPESLLKFICQSCSMPVEALRPIPPADLPEPARRLLVHPHDMTSTLADFHGSALQVEILQQRRQEDLYLREVFLRTRSADVVVEYGVIAIALEQFTPQQQEAIQAGQTPLGALLHRFQIPFESAPVGYFSVATANLAEAHRTALKGPTCFGRFNQLAKPTAEPLAWIMEILPDAAGMG